MTLLRRVAIGKAGKRKEAATEALKQIDQTRVDGMNITWSAEIEHRASDQGENKRNCYEVVFIDC